MKCVAHTTYLLSTAEALQRVFLPSLTPHPKSFPPLNSRSYRLPIIQRRHATFRRLQSPPQPQATGNPRDEAIGPQHLRVQVVDRDGVISPPSTLQDALASIDRKVDFLVHVGDKVHPRYADESGPKEGEPDLRPRIPVCKIINKGQFRLAEATKLKAKKDASALGKEVEIHWTMAPHDLKHRLERLKTFLDQGRRVEVVFGKKRKGWKDKKDVTDEEAKYLLRQIRDSVAEVEGAKEWKEMAGVLKGQLVMFFEAKREKPEAKKRYEGGFKNKAQASA
ncbi:MAG: hypothetical protein Q9225_006436 [Loekoesia sp. 1 TL-2023]